MRYKMLKNVEKHQMIYDMKTVCKICNTLSIVIHITIAHKIYNILCDVISMVL